MTSIITIYVTICALHLIVFNVNQVFSAATCSIKPTGNNNQVYFDCNGKGVPELSDIPINVTDLDLKNNKINNFTGLANLTQFHNLTKLYLSYNTLTTSPTIQSNSLTHLYLDNNRIANVTLTPSFDCPILLILNLAQNQIAALKKSDFARVSQSLNTLMLSGNSLEQIEDGVFPSALKKLELKSCPKLMSGSFTNFTQRIGSLQKLESLDVSSSFPTTENNLNGTVPSFPNLLHLYLAMNKLPFIGSDFFSHFSPKLQTLFLTSSNIQTIQSRAFANLASLQTLLLDKNEIVTLPSNAFQNTTVSSTLDISTNKLSTIEENAFSGLKVVNLNLIGNDITSISDKAFTGILTLQSLQLSYCQIKNISANVFIPLRSFLTSLDLSLNQLSELNDFVGSDVSGDFGGMSALKYLNISDNPFNCSCDVNGKFIEWLRNNNTRVSVKDKEKLQCFDRPGQNLISIDCSGNGPTTTTASTTTITTTIPTTSTHITTTSSSSTASPSTLHSSSSISSTSSNPTTTSVSQNSSTLPPAPDVGLRRNVIIIVFCAIGTLLLLVLTVWFVYRKILPRGHPVARDNVESDLLDTRYADSNTRCTDCIAMSHLTRLWHSSALPETHDERPLLNPVEDTYTDGNRGVLTFATNCDHDVLLLYSRMDEIWSNEFASSLENRHSSLDLKPMLVNQLDSTECDIFTKASRAIVILSSTLPQMAAESGNLASLVKGLKKASTVVIIRKSKRNLIQQLNKGQEKFGEEDAKMWISCTEECDLNGIITDVLSQLNLA